MNKRFVARLLIAAATVGAAGAHAQGMAQVKIVPGVEVRGSAQTYHLAPHEFDDYVGRYLLDHGGDVRFFSRGARAFVSFNGHAAEVLQPVAVHRFATQAGADFSFQADEQQVQIEMPAMLASKELR